MSYRNIIFAGFLIIIVIIIILYSSLKSHILQFKNNVYNTIPAWEINNRVVLILFVILFLSSLEIYGFKKQSYFNLPPPPLPAREYSGKLLERLCFDHYEIFHPLNIVKHLSWK